MMKLRIPRSKITHFCQQWNVVEFGIFGSALQDHFRADSDVDVMVTFSPDAHPTLFDMVRMQEELEGIFGRKVDLISKGGLENSRNILRRQAILETMQVIHVAR